MKNKVLTQLVVMIAILLNICVGCSVTFGAIEKRSFIAQKDDIELREIGQISTGELAINLHLKGDIVFVVDYKYGLYTFNISDLEHPIELNNYNEVGLIHQPFFENDFVYLADQEAGLRIIDVSDPFNPVQIGQFHDGGEIMGVTVYNNFAFLSDFEEGLEVVNISDPTQASEVSQFDVANQIMSIHINNDLAYVPVFIPDSDNILRILNISDINNIKQISQYSIGNDEIFCVEFDGDIAYMTCLTGGLKIYNISDSLNLIEMGSYYDGGHASDVEIIDDLAIIADHEDGIEVLNISDPTSPYEITEYYDGGAAIDLEIVNDYIFVADGEDGLEILKIEIVPGDETSIETGKRTSGFNLFTMIVILFLSYFMSKMRKY